MENIVYNELVSRGYSVDVGVVYKNTKDKNGKSERSQKEIDFIAILGGKKLYIQSAFAIESEDKKDSEYSPLNLTGDSFSKIVVRNDVAKSWYDDNGVLTINVIDFLLGEW
jgi:predicted AAA+ superfamily ATPase